MNGQRINPLDLIQQIKSGANPQQLVLDYLSKNMEANNPLMANMLKMAQAGDGAGITDTARNIFSQQGRDFDKEFNSFRKTMGI